MATGRELLEGPRGAAIGLVVTLAVALAIALDNAGVAWWVHADPDGAYAGSGLNLLRGEHTQYLDHPGLPTQVGLAVAFGGDWLVQRARGSDSSLSEYVDAQLLQLDDARPVFRTWAVLQYVLGAAIVYVAIALLLGHWTWGLAGALLYLVAPGLAEISTLLRPDTAMTALCVAAAAATAGAWRSRDATLHLAAAFLLGFAVTWKLTAVGLVPVVAASALLRPPAPGWAAGVRGRVGAFPRRWRVPLAAFGLLWLVLAVLLNRGRFPFVETSRQRDVLLLGAAIVFGYLGYSLAATRFRIPGATRIFVPFYGWMMLAFVAGLAVPATLALDAGAQMPVSILDTLTGNGVNEGIDPFSEVAWRNFQEHEQRAILLVGALALAGAVVGAIRRTWWPLLLAVGSATLAVMAAARVGFDYYFAPAFGVAIPGALWVLQRRGRIVSPLAWVAVLVAFLPLLTHLPTWYEDPRNAAAEELAPTLLGPGEVALAPPPTQLPLEDTWWQNLVEGFVNPVPAYPYRFMDGTAFGRAEEHGLRPRYAVAPVGELPPEGGEQEWFLAGTGPFVARRLPTTWGPDDAYGVVEVVALPEASP